MIRPIFANLLLLLMGGFLFSASLPYTGKLSQRGVNYTGSARFAFQIIDVHQNIHWQHDDESNSTIPVSVANGRYSVNLGGQGMNPLSGDLFLNKRKLFLRIKVNLKDGNGLQLLIPDQPITSVPHALTADLATYAQKAALAEVVSDGAITLKMLDERIQHKLDANVSIPTGFITPRMLSDKVSRDLNRTVTYADLSDPLRNTLGRKISKSMLEPDVLSDLNRTITASNLAPNTITTAQLNEQVLKYLRPEVLQSPEAPGLVFHGQRVILQSRAEGKYLSYQWYRDGEAIPGATQKRYVIPDVNGSLHDGNYTLVVSNDFGTVTTPATELKVDATPPYHTVSSIGLEMIFCPPGTFTMGSPANEPGRGGDETPHTVTLTHGFYLGKYEVTQAQYQTVMNGNSEGLGADPSQYKGSNRPVEKVSWEDAQVFLAQLNAIEQTAGRLPAGWEYALPTEAQWEYACRAGTSTIYSWGNDINSSRANYNWDGGAHDGNDSKQTVEIGQFSANPWGFFDMHGNVWEWVHDWKANYPGGALTDPVGPASGSYRVYGVVPGPRRGGPAFG